MAGQEERSFRTTDPQAPSFSGAATVKTAQGTPTVARYDTAGRAQAFQAMSNSFGNFFNGINQTLQQVNRTVQTEQYVETQRENESLAKQGAADQGLGKELNPEFGNRESYYQAYQNSAADTHAFELGQGLQTELRNMPKDGSVSPETVAADYFRKQVGSGTGDRDFDSRLLFSYHRVAQGLVASTNERVAQTVEQNTTQGILDDASTQMNSPEGLTSGKFATLYDRVQTVTKGDHVQADKIVEAMLSDPRNLTQSLSMLNALQDSGWADRNPQAYERISQNAVQNIHKVKSVQAGIEVDSWNAKAHMLAMNPNATPADWANMAVEAQRIDSNHGVGMQHFGEMFTGMAAAAKRQGGVNLFLQTVNGYGGSHDPSVIAQHYGKSAASVVDEHMDPGITALVSGPGSNYPALRDSTGNNAGYVNPLDSDQAADEYAQLITQPMIRQASGAGQPPRIKTALSNALTGTDPEQGARAFRIMNQVYARVGPHDFGRYFAGDQAQAVYWGMKAIAPANGDTTQIFKDIRDNRIDSKILAKVGENGEANLPALFGKDMKPQELQDKVDQALNKGMLKSVDRTGIIRDPRVGMDSDTRAQLMSIVADQAIRLKSAGNLDLDTALDNAVKVFANTRIAVPGQNGALRIYADPWAGQGRALNAPINADPNSPLTTLKGYKPIYAGFPMKNALGEEEDPVKTAVQDIKAMSHAFPGMVQDSDQYSLGKPRSDGLMPLLNVTGQPLQFHAGQDVTIRGEAPIPFWSTRLSKKDAEVAGKVPNDPDEATEFFKKNLPPGFYANYQPSTHTYTIQYGYRLKGDKEAQQDAIDSRGKYWTGNAAVNPPPGLGASF